MRSHGESTSRIFDSAPSAPRKSKRDNVTDVMHK